MQNFLPWHGLAGGILIGLAVMLHLLANGRLSGISGILEGAIQPASPSFPRNLAYVLGLPLGALVVSLIAPALAPSVRLDASTAVIIAAGLLVGFGTRIANGCTSGHGVCGLPRFSRRSIAATLAFMATGMATAVVTRHLM